MIAEITQSDYSQITAALDLPSISCPHCKCAGLCVFAYYTRLLKNHSYGEKTKLRILRVRCLNKDCRKTHAVLPSSIVPYSQITMADTIKIIQSDSREAEEDILKRNIHLNLSDIIRTRIRFTLYWKSRISDIEAAMGDSSFFSACIDKFNRQFMQLPFTFCGYCFSHTPLSALAF